MAEAAGHRAKRAYASDGQSLGRDKECDILVEYTAQVYDVDFDPVCLSTGHGWRTPETMSIQAKKSKAHPEWPWQGLENVDVMVIGKNRKPPLAILPFGKLLELLQ